MTRAARAAEPGEATPAVALHVGPFFLIAALSVSIVAFLLLRGQPLVALVLVAITLVAAGLTAAAVYRAVAPLGATFSDEPLLVEGRTRAALERDKALSLRSIKELEFDHAMGKISDADFFEMRERLRARAVRLMSQLEGSALYRERIERDLAGQAGQAGPAGQVGGRSGGLQLCGVRDGERRRRAILQAVRAGVEDVTVQRAECCVPRAVPSCLVLRAAFGAADLVLDAECVVPGAGRHRGVCADAGPARHARAGHTGRRVARRQRHRARRPRGVGQQSVRSCRWNCTAPVPCGPRRRAMTAARSSPA